MAAAQEHTAWRIGLEAGVTFQNDNSLRVDGRTGTRFDMNRLQRDRPQPWRTGAARFRKGLRAAAARELLRTHCAARDAVGESGAPGASQGRAIGLRLRAAYEGHRNWQVTGGWRFVDGSARNRDVFNLARFHTLTAGVAYRL